MQKKRRGAAALAARAVADGAASDAADGAAGGSVGGTAGGAAGVSQPAAGATVHMRLPQPGAKRKRLGPASSTPNAFGTLAAAGGASGGGATLATAGGGGGVAPGCGGAGGSPEVKKKPPSWREPEREALLREWTRRMVLLYTQSRELPRPPAAGVTAHHGAGATAAAAAGAVVGVALASGFKRVEPQPDAKARVSRRLSASHPLTAQPVPLPSPPFIPSSAASSPSLIHSSKPTSPL